MRAPDRLEVSGLTDALEGCLKVNEFSSAGHEVLELLGGDVTAVRGAECLPAIENGEAVADGRACRTLWVMKTTPMPFFRTRSIVLSTLAV